MASDNDDQPVDLRSGPAGADVLGQGPAARNRGAGCDSRSRRKRPICGTMRSRTAPFPMGGPRISA